MGQCGTGEATGKTTIKLDGLGEVGDRKTRFFKGEGLRAIVAFGDGVVEQDGVGLVVSTNSDAVKHLSLGGQSGFFIVGIMVEVADGEEFEPCFSLKFGAMYKFIGCSEFAAKTAWDLIDHHGGVADGIVPKFSSNFFSVMKALAMVMMVRQVHLARLLDD